MKYPKLKNKSLKLLKSAVVNFAGKKRDLLKEVDAQLNGFFPKCNKHFYQEIERNNTNINEQNIWHIPCLHLIQLMYPDKEYEGTLNVFLAYARRTDKLLSNKIIIIQTITNIVSFLCRCLKIESKKKKSILSPSHWGNASVSHIECKPIEKRSVYCKHHVGSLQYQYKHTNTTAYGQWAVRLSKCWKELQRVFQEISKSWPEHVRHQFEIEHWSYFENEVDFSIWILSDLKKILEKENQAKNRGWIKHNQRFRFCDPRDPSPKKKFDRTHKKRWFEHNKISKYL